MRIECNKDYLNKKPLMYMEDYEVNNELADFMGLKISPVRRSGVLIWRYLDNLSGEKYFNPCKSRKDAVKCVKELHKIAIKPTRFDFGVYKFFATRLYISIKGVTPEDAEAYELIMHSQFTTPRQISEAVVETVREMEGKA